MIFFGLLLIISFSANFLSAFAGGGAGLIQLPALILLGLPFPIALGTHKIASVALGLGAGIRHLQEKQLKPYITLIIVFFGLPAVFLGAKLALYIPGNLGSILLGLMTCMLGLYSVSLPNLGTSLQSCKRSFMHTFIGGMGIFLIGLLNGSFSSGTGLFVTLWLVRWFGLSYSQAVGYTLVLVGIAWNGTGALTLSLIGEIRWNWLPTLIGGSLLGGYFGAQFSISSGSRVIKTAFEYLSIVMGFSIILRSLSQ